ncbi:MAG: phosphatase PAP2 family protein [Clostridia bacterium]|nr:phosphatase PAP2 family protein [Clostridia bacterium]
MKNRKKDFCVALVCLVAFVCFTVLVRCVDVAPIGPNGSTVGFSSVNGLFHRLTGVHMSLYHLTDWLGLFPVGLAMGFAVLGLFQWIKKKSIGKVDRSLLVLGGSYIVLLVVYLLFEELALNYRPVLIDGRLEASYPSSTTLLVLCVIPTAAMQLGSRVRQATGRRWLIGILIAFLVITVLLRLLSGVHWLTDIVGGCLLSAGLVALYRALA